MIRRTKILLNTTITTSSILLALIASELFLKFLNYKPLLISPQKKVSYNKKICSLKSINQGLEEKLFDGPLGNQFRQHDQYGYFFKDFPDFEKAKIKSENEKKVLVLGDSFTWGASADKGKGYIDITAEYFKKNRIVFYNTSAGGYGQNNQLGILKNWIKIKPDLIILGFYTGNDFMDNLSPIDRYFGTDNGWFTRYNTSIVNGKLSVKKKTDDELLELIKLRECANIRVKQSVKNFLYKTRLGSLIFLAIRKIRFSPNSLSISTEEDLEYTITKKYLKEISDLSKNAEITLRIVLIPDFSNSTPSSFKPSKNYLKAKLIMDELKISFIEVIDKLEYSDYVGAFDDHWNNSGHKKMSEILIKEIDKLFLLNLKAI